MKRFLSKLLQKDIRADFDIRELSHTIERIADAVERQGQVLAEMHVEQAISKRRDRDEKCISRCHGQVYSQNNEDGIIAEIFERIGTDTKKFVEIAAGDGIENTTRLLLDLDWTGVWVEAGDAEVSCIKHVVAIALEQKKLTLIDKLITLENIDDALLAKIDFVPDYISVDIDYNTSHVLRRLLELKPRALCVEYNGHYPPSVDYEVPYKPDGVWMGTTRFGASLKALERIALEKGYNLVGCDVFGVNAFFVRADLCSEDKFSAPFTAEHHYEPPRYSAVRMRGHDRHPNI